VSWGGLLGGIGVLTWLVVAAGTEAVGMLGSTQGALGWGGAVTAGAGAVGLGGAAPLTTHSTWPVVANLIVVAVTALAGLTFAVQRRHGRLPWGGVALTGIWLLVLAWLPPQPARPEGADEVASSRLSAARRMLVRPGSVARTIGLHTAQPIACWDVDLEGPVCDVVLVDAAREAAALSTAQTAVLVQRCLAALRPGGRLVFTGRANEWVGAAATALPAPLWRVTARGPAGDLVWVVAAADAREWLARVECGSTCLDVQPLDVARRPGS